ncbi:general secretion pathway protein GspK [Pseudomonas sp. FEN]|uniref:general secretion pathway protein GspK n=1 Tax=Pseudomonas sp. FEN TaxID=2767468 RepID=UPI00174A1972|nr:type II secretion system protein GspK [Pseudomonas sp. FEN]CAD5203750.1 General secretion pathway protein K [Pseudomonas sp. FEN]
MNRSGQRGVALISVLLIMTLALFLVGGLLRSHTRALQSSAQHIHQVQLRQWALAAESWARELLLAADPLETKTINLAQPWARPVLPFELSGVERRIEIEDLAGRFNLTRLLLPGKADEISQARWSRLLAALEIPVFDLAPLRGTEVSDTSQLRLLPGVDQDLLQRLQPFVALLPAEATLNVNTASATLLATLEDMTPASARDFAAQRPPEGYVDAHAFTRAPGLDGLGIASHGLGVDSRWFRVTVEVGAGTARLRLVSDLERSRDSRRLRVLQRRFLAPTQGELPL